ncbi:MAG: CPBP family intramembrane metalloprotease [Sideroxydans sp.]|nr:CPBP family intramembrane metalloprotease [Sideroxydans sp.]
MKFKIAALLLLMALPGVIVTSWIALPLLVDVSKTPVPLETLQVASAVQGAVFVLIAALVGASLAPRVGLAAPAVSAVASRGSVLNALRPQVVPGLVGGAIGAIVILGFYVFAPESLKAIQPDTPLPLVVRVLYGGITEEVLVRWGLMTVLVWVGWRALRRDLQEPSAGIIWGAIAISALVFGLSHLPSVAQSLPAVTPYFAAYVTIGNALFGLIAGHLFWRYGLEAAVIAHVSAHILAFVIRG